MWFKFLSELIFENIWCFGQKSNQVPTIWARDITNKSLTTYLFLGNPLGLSILESRNRKRSSKRSDYFVRFRSRSGSPWFKLQENKENTDILEHKREQQKNKL